MNANTENKIIDILKKVSDKTTTQYVADQLNLSRSVTSNYLNQLLSENKIYKSGSKPVLWSIEENEEVIEQNNVIEVNKKSNISFDVFDRYIGSKGSQKNIIKQCKAAVKYPPIGIPILLIGESGTGKSYLASLIYEYAVQEKIIKKNAPFKVLNCADYANNPELLSAALFGYRKGSFTGAEKDQKGLLDTADGGILFLDEVHRLSRENQEKLFVFMDKGKFLRLGDGHTWNKSSVRLICATTENINEVLLETFRRRIGVKLYLQSLKNQPLFEKIQLVERLYTDEARRINKNIHISPDVVDLLISGEIEGNVGGIKNVVRMSCANAIIQNYSEELEIRMSDIPEEYQNISNINFKEKKPIKINIGEDNTLNKHIYAYVNLEKEFIELVDKIVYRDKSTDMMDIIVFYRRIIKTIKTQNCNMEILNQKSEIYYFRKLCYDLKNILMGYGINDAENIAQEMSSILLILQNNILSKNVYLNVEDAYEIVKELFPRTAYIFIHIKEIFNEYKIKENVLLNIMLILGLQSKVNETIKLGGVLIAHGNSTASSIKEVVNRIHGTFVFEAFDMPIECSVTEIIEKVKEFLKNYDTSNGLILMIDMGSLGQLYTAIKDFIKGNLLIIDNLSTAMVLDVGMKMINNHPFEQIAQESGESYKIKTQYFEGLSIESNIIISCLSGMGISERLKEIISDYIPSKELKILTMEYSEIKRLIVNKEGKYFNKTKLLITTNDIEEMCGIKILNIYNTLRKEGEETLWSILSEFISKENFQSMMKEIIKSFSIEGVGDRLKILNPNIVISEAEFIIESYESYYNVELKGYKKLNLFMHLSLMIERLVSSKENKDDCFDKDNDHRKLEFFQISSEILSHTEEKFNIKVPIEEIVLLYEVFKQLL